VAIALGTRVDSTAARDALRGSATAKKLAAGDLLRKKNGKVFGVFSPEAWTDFKQQVSAGKGDEAIEKHIANYGGWAAAMAELGAAEQAQAFANGKPVAVEAPIAETQLPDGDVREETDDIPLLDMTDVAALRDRGISEATLDTLMQAPSLTEDDVQETLAVDRAFLARARQQGITRSELAALIDGILSLYANRQSRPKQAIPPEERGRTARVAEIRDGTTEVARSRPTEAPQEAVVSDLFRASDADVARAWGAVVSTLTEAGIDVRAVQAAIDQGTQGSTPLAFDQRRFVELVLKDIARPSRTDLEVAVHEAVHVLFATQPDAIRDALHRAVATLPEVDPATNLSLQETDPAVRAEEKLAVWLQGGGMEAGKARGFASRLVRFVKDIYFRTARAIALALGVRDAADAFALRYFGNRLSGLLQGDYAPQSILNALGGRALTWSERAMLLPGFGGSLGRVINGQMFWAPKVPDTEESLAHNLDLAFSRPPASDSEANVRKGIDAVNAILADNSITVRGAMFRPEVGSITFEWGTPGDATKAFRGGFGLGHIIARRSVVGGQDPTAVIASLIETIAYGDASAPYGGEGDTRVRIDDGNNSVILSLARHGKRETWVITTFDNTRGQTPGSMVKNASVTGAKAKDVPSTEASQKVRAFSPDDLVAVTDKLKVAPRLRVVKAGDMVYSRPLQAAAIGNTEPANAINRDVATINHMIALEAHALAAVAANPKTQPVYAQWAAAGKNFAEWFRSRFGFEDPTALKATALARLDPQTQQPVAGVNQAQAFADFADVSNSAPAKIHAHLAAWRRLKSMSKRMTEDRHELVRAQNQLSKAQNDFLQAHREYLNAEGLTALVLRGTRQMLARERRLTARTSNQVGVVMQQLREIDAREVSTIDREYSDAFKKLFAGNQLRGRNLFDLLDQLVNDAKIDFHGLKITEIRQKISERVAANMASPELGMLVDSSTTSRALLATVVAYAKTNQSILVQIERRRLKNIADRTNLQGALDKLIAERDITNQAITDLPRTAKLEERARILYIQEKRRTRAIKSRILDLEQRIAAAEAAMPVYRAGIEELQRDLGGVMPEYTFGDGMTYRVPSRGANGMQFQLQTLTLSSAGQITDRATLDKHLEEMTTWLAMKEALGELDADYRDIHAARHALLSGGYFESDIRKTDVWVLGNVFMPVGAKAEATGLPSGRIVGQMVNRFASVENELRNQGQRLGDRNNRLRDAVVGVLNRGRAKGSPMMTPDRYATEVAIPAMSILEKSKDLLEMGLTPEVAMARAHQRVINYLLSNPSTESFVRGKEGDVAKALRAHIDALAETSKFYNDTNARYQLGVRDERLIATRGDGEETAGIRESLPVGLQTFSRRASSSLGRAYRAMRAAGWGAMRDAVADIAELYDTQGPDAVRQALKAYFSDRSIIEDFTAAMAETDTYSPFDAPVLPDGVTRPEADPARAAAAWRASAGDIVAFIEAMYDLHHGTTGKGLYVQDTLRRMVEYFGQIGDMLDSSESGMVPDGLSRLAPNLMIDARTLDRWPTAWTEYLFFDPHTNHQLARRVAAQVAFGRDTDRLANVWATMEDELEAAASSYDEIMERGRRAGYVGSKLRKFVEADYVQRLGAAKGKAEFARIEKLSKLRPVISDARDSLRAFFTSRANQLDATRLAAQIGQTIAFGMLNNPGTALLNLADLFAPVAQGGVSTSTLKQVLRNWRHLSEGVAGSLGQAIGLDLMKSSRLQNLYVEMGLNDPAVALQYIGRTEDGFRSDITADQAPVGRQEAAASRGLRVFTRALSFGVTPKGDASRFTALRPLAPFQQFVHETMRASTLSTWRRVEDMVLRGIEYFAANPQYAADPTFKITADVLGLKGAEHAAFEAFRRRLAEGYGLELTTLAREAMARQAGPRNLNELLSRTTRALLQGMVANELILEGNLATMTPKAWTSSVARFALPLWGWPIRRAMQVLRTGLDPESKFRIEAVSRGLVALGVMAGAGLAMSLLADEYHERIVGRKRNLRSVSSLPDQLAAGNFSEAFLTLTENVNRAGTFGVLGEVVNTGINLTGAGGDNRTLSVDQRVVMMNSLLTLSRAISTTFAQGEVDYAGVARPAVMALGGNSALQYLQIGNNALGLDNAESRFIERVDTQNRLRVAGRELGLEVRTGGAAGYSHPTELTPIITRMVLAAYAGDRADFLANWRDAIQAAREMGKEDPVAYVRDSFASRNPLKNVFRTISQDDYTRLLRHLDDDGRREVRSGIDRFNAFAESLDAKAFTGSTRQMRSTVSLDNEALRRQLLGL
jgi:hypothetical protein